MKLVVGLGNPGPRFSGTRHNIGFMVVDRLAADLKTEAPRPAFRGLMAEARLDGEKVLLLKPQTFMNLSGDSVAEAVSYYRLDPARILAVYDDMDLDLGRLRFRLSGSAGGHRGAQSIIQRLGTPDFPRLKLGVGRPPAGTQAADYVLTAFTAAEFPVVEETVSRAAQAVMLALKDGVPEAMNRINGT